MIADTKGTAMSGKHTADNLNCEGYYPNTGRLSFSIPSESEAGRVHHFTVGILGDNARCSCRSFVERGYCTLTRNGENIARAALVTRYEALSGTELTKRYGELAAAVLDRSADATQLRLFAVCAQVLNLRLNAVQTVERAVDMTDELVAAA
jgi:hypothetical protein